MNDWYIDRSKNFVNESLDAVLNYLADHNEKKKSAELIEQLIENNIFKEKDGNPNAALTRFRDHGLIDNENKIGDSAFDYVQGILTRDELIIDLLLKRPCLKKNSPDLKPFILLCNVFELMFELNTPEDDIFLTYSECFKYLYPCNSVDEISIETVDDIINNRTYADGNTIPDPVCLLKGNEATNLSIWFNALRNTSLFIPEEDRSVLKPNPYQRDFFTLISLYGYKISHTPTDTNKNLYDYYCSKETGITEIIPKVFIDNVLFRDDEEIRIVYNYLFGIKKEVDFDFSYYFESDCFGIYHPFLTIPGLVIRKISLDNLPLGRKLLNYCRK